MNVVKYAQIGALVMQEIFRGAALIFFFKLFGAASLFFSQIVISRILGVESLGIFNIFLSMFMILLMFGQLGTDLFLVKELPRVKEDSRVAGVLLYNVFSTVIISSLLITAILMLSSDWVDNFLFKSTDVGYELRLVSLCFVCYAFNSVIPEVFRGLGNNMLYAFFKGGLQNALILVFLLVGVSFDLLSQTNVLVVIFVSVICTFIVQVTSAKVFLAKQHIFLSKLNNFRSVLLQSLPMFVVTSSMMVMGYLDSLMIGYFLGEFSAGLYASAIQLSLIVTFVLTSINGFIAPKISIHHFNENKGELKSMYFSSVKLAIVVASPICCLLLLFPEQALSVYGVEYKAAKDTLTILVTAYFINVLIGPVGYFLNMTGNQKVFMKIVLFALVLNAILNFFLIPQYGITGAAIATLISTVFWKVTSFLSIKCLSII